MAYRPGSFWLRRGQLVLTDAAGDVVQNLGPPYRTLSMALSPDSKRLALEVANAENKSADIWIMDVPGASVSRLTSFAGAMRTFSVPVWSPSGDRVLATSFTGQLWVSRPDRPNAPTQPLTHELDGAGGFPTDWSPDGRYVVVDQWDATTQTDIWLLPTDPEGTPEEYAKTRYFEGGGRVSPDGNWLAYTSHESGRPLIFLDTFPQPTSRIVVTSASGEWPRWSTDGRALYYIGPESTVMRASLSLEGDRPQVADPETLFHLTSGFAVNDISRSPYEVLGDGEQFIFNQEIPEENPDTITVVVNWPAALKR
jgi:dipeptidyl aminopeptidase/acylaminoacyl peptidase